MGIGATVGSLWFLVRPMKTDVGVKMLVAVLIFAVAILTFGLSKWFWLSFGALIVAGGADMVSVHIEADPHIHRTLTSIRSAGGKAGIAINPATPLAALEEALPFADFVLVMSVNPGFGGQAFIPTAVDKVRRLREMIESRSQPTRIEIDGGIDAGNILEVVEAGAEILVAGSAIYGKPSPAEAVRELLEKGTVWV